MPQHLESCIAAELGLVPTWTTTVLPLSVVSPTCQQPRAWANSGSAGASAGVGLQNQRCLRSQEPGRRWAVQGLSCLIFWVLIYFSKAPKNRLGRMPRARTNGCRGPAAGRIRVL